MNPESSNRRRTVRLSPALALLLVLILLCAGYVLGYFVLVHREYSSVQAIESDGTRTRFLFADEWTITVFRPMIWAYERLTGSEVAFNPTIYPAPSD